jgi:hypothetical protein
MTDPRSNDRPDADMNAPTPPVIETAPPLVPADQAQSPWWTAPSGKPFSIPDFSHEFSAFLAALLDWLFPGPAPVPVPVKAQRRR